MINHSEIQNKIALRVLAVAQSKDQSFSLDPVTIVAIINCIIAVIRLLYICYSREGAANALKKNNLLHKVVLRREVRKRFKNKEERKVVYASMLDAHKSLSEHELTELLNSVEE